MENPYLRFLPGQQQAPEPPEVQVPEQPEAQDTTLGGNPYAKFLSGGIQAQQPYPERIQKKTGWTSEVAGYGTAAAAGFMEGTHHLADTLARGVAYGARIGGRIDEAAKQALGVEMGGFLQNYYKASSKEEAADRFKQDMLSTNDRVLGDTARWLRKKQAEYDPNTWAAFVADVAGGIAPGIVGFKASLFAGPAVGYEKGLERGADTAGMAASIGKETAIPHVARLMFNKLGALREKVPLTKPAAAVGQGLVGAGQSVAEYSADLDRKTPWSAKEAATAAAHGFATFATMGALTSVFEPPSPPGARGIFGRRREKTAPSPEEIAAQASAMSEQEAAEVGGEYQTTSPRGWNTEHLARKKGEGESREFRTTVAKSTWDTFNVTVLVKVPKRDPGTGEYVRRDGKTIPHDVWEKLTPAQKKIALEKLIDRSDAELTVEMGDDIYGTDRTTSLPNTYAITQQLRRMGGFTVRRAGINPETGRTWSIDEPVQIPQKVSLKGGGKKGQHPQRKDPDGNIIGVDRSLKWINGVLMRGVNPWQEGREWEPDARGGFTRWVAVPFKSGRLRPEAYLGEEIPGREAPPPEAPPPEAPPAPSSGMTITLDERIPLGRTQMGLEGDRVPTEPSVSPDYTTSRRVIPPKSWQQIRRVPPTVMPGRDIPPDLLDPEGKGEPIIPSPPKSGGPPSAPPAGGVTAPPPQAAQAPGPKVSAPTAAPPEAPAGETGVVRRTGPVVLPEEGRRYIDSKEKPAGGKYSKATKPVKDDTKTHAEGKLRALFEYFDEIGVKDFRKASIEDIENFVKVRIDVLADRTKSMYVSVFQKFYAFADMPEMAVKIAKLSPGRGTSEQHPQLTPENERKFVENFTPANDTQRVIHYLLQTGARVSDLVGTDVGKPEDRLPGLRNSKRYITFERDKDGMVVGAYIRYDRKYGGMTKDIPVPTEVARSLERLIEGLGENEKILRITRNRGMKNERVVPMIDRDINNYARLIQKAVGIPEDEMATTHGLRGTYASRRFNLDGVPVSQIAHEIGDEIKTVVKSGKSSNGYIIVGKEALLPSGANIPDTPDVITPNERADLIRRKALEVMKEKGGLEKTEMFQSLKDSKLNSQVAAWIRMYEKQVRWLFGEPEGEAPEPPAPKGAAAKAKTESSHGIPVSVVDMGGSFFAVIEDSKLPVPVSSRAEKTRADAIRQAKALHTLALDKVGTGEDVNALLTMRPPSVEITPTPQRQKGALLDYLSGKLLVISKEEWNALKPRENGVPNFTTDRSKGVAWDKAVQEMVGLGILRDEGTDVRTLMEKIQQAQAERRAGTVWSEKEIAQKGEEWLRKQDEASTLEQRSQQDRGVERAPKKDGGTTLSGGFPGQAVLEVIKTIPETARAAKALADHAEKSVKKSLSPFSESAKKAVAPQFIDESGRKTSDIVRENIGLVDRFFGILEHMQTNKTFAKVLESMKRDERLAFLQWMDTKEGSPANLEALKNFKLTPELRQIASIVNDLNKYVLAQVRDHKDPDHRFDPRPYYAPHIFRKTLRLAHEAWKDTGKIKALYDRGFMMERAYADIYTALQNKAELVTTNPIELYALRWYGMMKYVTIQKAIKQLEATKDARRLERGERLPPGYEKVDQFSNVAFKPGAAAVLRNYLSHTLWTHEIWGPTYSALQRFNHSLNMFQLGLGSLFHISFTGYEAQVSTLSEALTAASVGDWKTAGKMFARGVTPLSVIMKYINGRKLVSEYFNVGLDTLAQDVDKLTPDQKTLRYMQWGGGGFAGGFRHGWQVPRYYEATRAAIRSGDAKEFVKNVWGVPAELSTAWIMDKWVPWMKAGTFNEMMGNWMSRNPNATREQIRTEAGKIWNHVDARLGAVRYDRLFMNNYVKNLAQFFIRAPGWKAGTVTEVAGGAVEGMKWAKDWWQSKSAAPPPIPRRMAYTISLLALTGAINYALTKVFNPDDKIQWDKDFWAFRTGAKDEKGRDVRFLLPSYMKDIYAVSHKPTHYITSSASPIMNFLSEYWANRTYYGEEIVRPGHRIEDTLLYTLRAYEPFWRRASKRGEQRDASFGTHVASVFGVMPASPVYSMSDGEKVAQELYNNQMGARTYSQESAEKREKRQRMLFLLRSGRTAEAEEIIRQYGFDRSIKEKVKKQAKHPYLWQLIQPLNDADTARVWEELSVQEKRQISKEFIHKLKKPGAVLQKDIRQRYLQDALRHL